MEAPAQDAVAWEARVCSWHAAKTAALGRKDCEENALLVARASADRH